MANDQLFIPKKIKVGCQWRKDTYTGKLAYVVYYNAKNQLAQEKSWRGWIHDTPQKIYTGYENGQYIYEDKEGIPIEDYENVPMEGFVLNRKAGGYGSGWNHRQTKCRVWDPRGFEFEITVENLLFILQESNSYKGKGLEGEFVYAWSGKDIVLLPCSGEDYKSSQEFTDLKKLSVHAKTLVPGRTYYTKDQEKVVYMGKYNYIEYGYDENINVLNNEHMFLGEDEVTNYYMEPVSKPRPFKNMKVNKLAKLVDENIVGNFAELVEELENSGLVTPFISIDINQFTNSRSLITDEGQNYNRNSKVLYAKLADNQYESFTLYERKEYVNNYNWLNINAGRNTSHYKFMGFYLVPSGKVVNINGNSVTITKKDYTTNNDRNYSPGEIDTMRLYEIGFKIKNIEKIKTI
jgi:hypothetical protein